MEIENKSIETLNFYREPTEEEKIIRELVSQYYHTVNNWYLWTQLDQSLNNFSDVYEKANVFFDETKRALLTTVIMGFCRLFDKDSRALSFYLFESDLESFRKTIDNERLKTVQNAYKILDEIRDQHISHHDKSRKQVKLISDNINIIKDYVFDFLEYLGTIYLNNPNVVSYIPLKGVIEINELIKSISCKHNAKST